MLRFGGHGPQHGPEALDDRLVRDDRLGGRTPPHHDGALAVRLLDEPADQPGLPGAGVAGDDDHPALPGACLRPGLAERGQLGRPPDERLVAVAQRGSGEPHGGRRWRAGRRVRLAATGAATCAGAGAGGDRRGEPVVVAEDRRLEPQQLGAGLEPELLDEALPGAVEGPQRLDLATRAVEAQHQLRGEPLVHRVVVDRPVELGDHVLVAAQLDLRVEAHLHGDEAQLVEVHGRGSAPLGVGHVGVGRAAPERERPLGGVPGEGRVGGERVAGPAGEQLERRGVHRSGGHVEHVARTVTSEQVGVAERPAQQ